MFTGSIVALITPFQQDTIDEAALRRLIHFHLEQGTDGIVPCGTTGEAVTMTPEEWERVITITVEEVAGQVPVVAGAGGNDTARVIDMVRTVKTLGADGALVVTPYYNKPPQAGLIAHYTAIARQVEIPLVVYNVPSRTGCNILPETMAEMAEIDTIVAIKEASGDLEQVGMIGALCGDRITILSGDDGLTVPIMSVGGQGVISVAANVAPAEVTRLVALYRKGEVAEALQLHYRLLPLFKAMFIETNPIPAKTAAGLMGLAPDTVRLPLVPMAAANRASLEQTLRTCGLLEGVSA